MTIDDEDEGREWSGGGPDLDSADAVDFLDKSALPDSMVYDDEGGFWVFAYGSLLWRPGFEPAQRVHARVEGFARRFSLWSHRYRGTPERPGLVLALEARVGARTRGIAYRVPPDRAAETRAYLNERELVTGAYQEVMAEVTPLGPIDGAPTPMRALTYVIRHGHRQHAADLCLRTQADIIARGHGRMGPNCEYLFNTVAHLRAIGLSADDLDDLDELERLVRRRLGTAGVAAPVD